MGRVIFFLYTGGYDPENLPSFMASSGCEDFSVANQGSIKVSWPFMNLKVHALVYKVADMLGIEDLKVLASDRFLNSSEISVYSSHKDFAAPLRLVYESTHADDRLRVRLTRNCLSNHESYSKIPEIVDVLNQYEHMFWSVTVPLLGEENRRMQRNLQETIKRTNAMLEKKCTCGLMVRRVALEKEGDFNGYCDSDRCLGLRRDERSWGFGFR